MIGVQEGVQDCARADWGLAARRAVQHHGPRWAFAHKGSQLVGDMTVRIRKPAVAGTLYPGRTDQLNATLDDCWTKRIAVDGPPPKAVIVPHAGYAYSGPVAASAYATLAQLAGTVTRVVLLGPSHRYAMRGFALPESQLWQTPLGMVEVDLGSVERLAETPGFVKSDLAHEREHSLEVHVPFLQRSLGRVQVLPILVGDVGASAVAAVLDHLWGGPETLIVISTDLSHYHDQATAKGIDSQTVRFIESLNAAALTPERACGASPVAGLLHTARQRNMRCTAVDVRTSADTAGDAARVVGYASFLLWQ